MVLTAEDRKADLVYRVRTHFPAASQRSSDPIADPRQVSRALDAFHKIDEEREHDYDGYIRAQRLFVRQEVKVEGFYTSDVLIPIHDKQPEQVFVGTWRRYAQGHNATGLHIRASRSGIALAQKNIIGPSLRWMYLGKPGVPSQDGRFNILYPMELPRLKEAISFCEAFDALLDQYHRTVNERR